MFSVCWANAVSKKNLSIILPYDTVRQRVSVPSNRSKSRRARRRSHFSGTDVYLKTSLGAKHDDSHLKSVLLVD